MKNLIAKLLSMLKTYTQDDFVAAAEIAKLSRQLEESKELSQEGSRMISRTKIGFENSLKKSNSKISTKEIADLISGIEAEFEAEFETGLEETPNPQKAEEGPKKIAPEEFDIFLDFIRESLDHLDGIEEKILELESAFNAETVNSIFRAVHTIKGTSAYFDLTDIKGLSHTLETLLDRLRAGTMQIDSAITDVLLEALDVLKEMIERLNQGTRIDGKSDYAVIPEHDFDITTPVTKIEGILEGRSYKAASETTIAGQKNILISEDLKGDFEQEAGDHLASIESILIRLESNPALIELHDDLFRSLHSLKGNAGLLLSFVQEKSGIQDHPLLFFKNIAHQAETIIQKCRDEERALIDLEISRLLRHLDLLRALLAGFMQGTDLSDEVKQAVGELEAGEEKLQEYDAEQTEDVQSEAFRNIFLQSMDNIEGGLRDIKQGTDRDTGIAKVKRAFSTLLRLAQKVNHRLLAEESKKSLALADAIVKGGDEKQILSEIETCLRTISSKGDRRSAQVPSQQEALEEFKKKPTSQALRVPEERLNSLLKLVMELAVSKNNLREMERDLSKGIQGNEFAHDLHTVTSSIVKVADELQNSVMKIRLVALRTVFSRFPRLVRDLARDLGKKIKLEISGEEIELDKTVIDSLGDPLVHLIRNAIDHGIATPAERVSRGKPEVGTIRLKAFYVGQNVGIQIKDDGNGIDPEVLKEKAIEKGLIESDAAQRMDRRELLDLIFLPGFSTAKIVSEVSGRGVGMDVVKTSIVKIGGSVELDSEIASGTSVLLTIPLTLAIKRGLEVEAGGEHYYVPLEYIEETVKITEENIRQYRENRMVVIRDRLMVLYDLAQILGSKNQATDTTNGNGQAVNVLVLLVNNRNVALKVDRYYRENEYMVSPLPQTLQNIKLFSGVTITGKGSIFLIVDPLKLIAN